MTFVAFIPLDVRTLKTRWEQWKTKIPWWPLFFFFLLIFETLTLLKSLSRIMSSVSGIGKTPPTGQSWVMMPVRFGRSQHRSEPACLWMPGYRVQRKLYQILTLVNPQAKGRLFSKLIIPEWHLMSSFRDISLHLALTPDLHFIPWKMNGAHRSDFPFTTWPLSLNRNLENTR